MKRNKTHKNSVFWVLLFIAIFFPWKSAMPLENTTRTETLRFGHISVEDPTITRRKYQPLLSKMEAVLTRKVELVQSTNYSSVIKLFMQGKVDMGILNSFSYIQIAREAKLVPIAKRVIDGRGYYQSYIIVNSDSNIKSLDDLKGKVFAFSDPNSTTGHLLPRLILQKNVINPEKDFHEVLFIGHHDSIILAVANRTADAGSVASYIFDGYDTRITKKIKIIDRSEPIPLGPLVVRFDLGKEWIDKIKRFFLSLHESEEGRSLLREARLSAFTDVQDKEYDIIRTKYNLFEKKYILK
jgi:phosphonate transport system substrate-binding protein